MKLVKQVMNRAKLMALVCIVLVTAGAGSALAYQGWGGGHCSKHHHSFKRMEKKLGLSDAQKAQVKELFKGNREGIKPIVTTLRTEQKNLQALLHSDTIDEAAIRAETAKIAGIQADLNVNRAKVGAQFRAILTPAQLETLKTMRHKRDRAGDKAVETPAQ